MSLRRAGGEERVGRGPGSVGGAVRQTAGVKHQAQCQIVRFVPVRLEQRGDAGA